MAGAVAGAVAAIAMKSDATWRELSFYRQLNGISEAHRIINTRYIRLIVIRLITTRDVNDNLRNR